AASARTRAATLYFLLMIPRPPSAPLFPYTTLFRSGPSARIPMRALIVLSAAAALSACGLDTATSAATAAALKKQELEQAKKTQRSEEHTSELQSLTNLVCRLLLQKKKEHAPTN